MTKANTLTMDQEEIIDKIRAFNRNYVRSIGLLERTVLNSNYSLTESHILHLINAHKKTTATQINKTLKLDEGYLSRVIKKLISKSLLTKEQSSSDKRIFEIKLTEKGQKEYQKIDKLSSESIRAITADLNPSEKLELASLFDRAMDLLYKE